MSMKKPPTIKDLKAHAFDVMQQIKQIEQEYNQVVQVIINKQNEQNTRRPLKEKGSKTRKPE